MTELRDPAEVFAAEIGWQPALERTDLLAEPVAAALRTLEAASPEAADLARQAQVVPIDPSHSDTDALNAHYDLDPEATGNCVLVAGKRTGEEGRTRDTAMFAITPQQWPGVRTRLVERIERRSTSSKG